MTFIAIQTPFITRRCGICGKQYLKEDFLSGDKLTEDETVRQSHNKQVHVGVRNERPKISLARLLFAVCERCTFCGGKFIG